MKKVLIVEPSSSGYVLIQKGKECGHKVIVMTYDADDRKIPERYLQYADELVIVDTNDDQAAIQKAREYHQDHGIDAVVPGFEYYVPLAAQISADLGLRGLNPNTVRSLREKDIMREALHAAGVRVPRFRLASTENELQAAIDYVGYPCVIKPVDLSGSMNVRKVSTFEELLAGYQAINQTDITDLGRLSRKDVLIEEYISGPEFSVEGYAEGDKVTFLSITEKLLSPEPYFVEVGHIVSADLGPDIEETVYRYVADVVRALNVTVGPFHCEIRLAEDGPVAMELAARLAGDHIIDLIEYAKGIDLYKITFDSFLGQIEEQKKPITLNRNLFAGIKFFFRPELRSYSAVDGLDDLKARPGFQEMDITLEPGRGMDNSSYAGRLGFMIYTNENYQELKTTLDEADRVVQFT